MNPASRAAVEHALAYKRSALKHAREDLEAARLNVAKLDSEIAILCSEMFDMQADLA